MPLIYTRDHAYLFAIDDEHDAEQSVVYDARGAVLWDRHSHEASLGAPAAPTQPGPVADAPGVPAAAPARGRVTDERDGTIVPRQYSYWPDAWIAPDGSIVVMAGIQEDGLVHFFRVARDGAVTRLGPLLPQYPSTGEDWYWDAAGWIYLLDGPRLRRVHPFTGADTVVFDVSAEYPGHLVWQAHSSDDGHTHSATLEEVVPDSDGNTFSVGTVVFRHGGLICWSAQGALDESQITPDGHYLLIKEGDYMRVEDLEQLVEHHIADPDGALGHSDCGPGIAVGEFSSGDVGACVLWDLDAMAYRILYRTWAMGHVARGGRTWIVSDSVTISLLDLITGARTPIVAHGATGTDYDDQVKANVDPTGRVACYMTNRGGARRDVYLAELTT